MRKIALVLPIRDYDHIAPLACGDIVAEGIDLALERGVSTPRTEADPAVQAGEIDLGGYLLRLARGDRAFVGTPAFVGRSFHHRDFFARRGSDLGSLADLAGRRVGISHWASAGSIWCRAALRDQGVGVDRIQWWVGPLEEASGGPEASIEEGLLPSHVRAVPRGRSLRAMLLEGELEAIAAPLPPPSLRERGGPIVRLIPDYPGVEREYLRRTGAYPADSIVALRRDLFDREPWVARNLYEAMEQSKLLALRDRIPLMDTSPWVLADIVVATEQLGPDWRPNGVGPNRGMIELLCHEMLAQGLIARPLDPASVFAEFEQAATTGR